MSENDSPVTSESDKGSAVAAMATGDSVGDFAETDGPRELTDEELAKLAELDEALEKFLGQKRWSDVIKTTIAKAELVQHPGIKAELFSEAGRLYVERSSNQAEAIKCFRHVLEFDPENLEAIERLKEMYEKRRDWERMVEVLRMECALLEPVDQPMRRVEIAQLATERLRKPAICIDLWQDVLQIDEANPEAISALANLYERAREWEPLADVLEKKSEQTSDPAELVQLLQKLGMIYADKLNNDQGAIDAFRRLLEHEPGDRRAQEQLKKRYVTARAWDELEEFYGATEKWDELIRTLERAADDKNAELDERITLHFRVARLWQDKQEKPDRAARAYEKVLGLDGSNLEAAEALAPIYEQAGDAKKLAGAHEIRLEHLEDPYERVELLRQTGLLYEERLRDPQTAFERFIEAFTTDPSQPELREDLGRLAAKVKDWDRVFAAYATAIENAGHPDDANDLRLHYGRVLRDADRIEDAIAQFRAVSDARADDRVAIEALDELYRRTENYSELLHVLQRRAELESEPDARRGLAYDVARLYQDQLGQAEQAIEAYRNICIEFGDGETEAYRALEGLYEGQERWEDLAQSLEHRIDLGPESDEELASLKFRLGKVILEHVGDSIRALDLFREVLMIVAEHEGAVLALETLLPDPELGSQAVEVLEPVYEAAGDWGKLIHALDVSLASVHGATERIDVITKIGELYAERAGDQANAFEVYCRALSEAPDNPGIGARLADLARAQNRLPEMVALLSELAAAAADPVLGRELWVRAAQIKDNELQDVEGSVAAYMQALELDDTDLEVLEALESLYRRTERWADLLGVLRRRVRAISDPAEQESLLLQMAFIHDEMLQQPEQAIAIHLEIFELDPGSTSALAALDGLYERQQMWSELAENVNRQLSLAEDEATRLQLMLRMGDIREARMGAVDEAISIYQEVLDRDPACEPAIAALERLLERPEQQARIAEILEPLYRDAGDIQKLIGVHEIQVSLAEEADQRVDLLCQIAELYELQLDDLERAFSCYARALAEEPGNINTQDQLERITATNGAYQALAETFEARVQGLEDPGLAVALLMKAAELRETQIGDADTAIAHYTKVLQLQEENLEAATALERLYHGAGRYEELAAIYRKKAAMLDVPDEQKQYYFQAGQIYEEILERPGDAVAVFQAVLEVEPDDLEALDKLIGLFLKLGRWEELLQAYSHKADIVDDPDQKKALLAEVGAVYERELQQTEKAIETYQRILEIDPEDFTAVGRLDVLYYSSENWEELLSILEREADLAPDPTDAVAFRYRIGELFELRLDDAFRAVEVYRDVLEIMPDHEATQQALERMIAANKESAEAARVLEPIYRSAAESAKLVNVLEVLVAQQEDPVETVELLHQIAELHEVHLDQPRQAFDAYARALPHDNENDKTLAALEVHGDQLGLWPEVVGLYDTEIAKLSEESPEMAVDLALRLARLCEVQVGDVEAAIARYRIVYQADPTHVGALEALDRLYEATERWPELADVLAREAEIAPSPDDALDLQYRLGFVNQTRLGNVEAAIEQYREIVNAAPEHEHALTALEGLFYQGIAVRQIGEILDPLYRMQDAWDKLVGVQQVLLQNVEDPEDRVQAMHRISETAEQRSGNFELAFAWMQRALLEDPCHDHSSGEVERLAAVTDGWPVLAGTYAQVLEADHAPELKLEVAKRQARLYEEELADVARAEEAYRFALGLQQVDDDVLAALDRIYTDHGAGPALAEVLRKRVAIAEDSFDKIELMHRLGNVLYNDVGRTDEAIEVFRAVLAEEPEHEETIHALQNVYTITQDWAKLFEVYEKELDVVMGDANQAEILGRMAVLAWTKLDNLDGAVDLLKRVLDLLGEDPEALNALGNIYAIQENWADLVDVLEREVSVSNDDQMRLRLYSDLGRIWYEKLQRDRNALESWERTLDIDPGYTNALFAMADIHRANESYEDLVDTLRRVIDVGAATLEDAAIENVYMQLGSIYETQLERTMEAVDAFGQALELNPRNFAAMDALERIHTAEEQWEDCIAVKGRRADALEDSREQIRVLTEMAEMWVERAEDPDRAVEPYTRILAIDGLNDEAFGKLEQIYRERERFEEQIELYVGRVESTEDADERVDLLRRVASVNERDLDDKNQAFEALLLAWTQDFTNEETARELERITGLTQRWNDLLTTANQSLQEVAADDSETRHAICLKCAKWYTREGHADYAIPYLQQVLAVDPLNVPAMRQMADLYRQTKQWQVYGQVLSRLTEMTEVPIERAEVYVLIGALQEEQFAALDEAISYYRKALDALPGHLDALKALERIFRERGQWPELIDILKRKVAAIEEPDEKLAAQLVLAEAYEEKLGDHGKAIGEFKAVVEEDSSNLPALKGLERLYAHGEQWQDLMQVLERQLELVTTERDQVDLLMRIGAMWEEEFLKHDKAAERLEQVIGLDPTYVDALQGLERLYRHTRRWNELIDTYERHVEVASDRAQKMELFERMGEVYRDELKDSDRAIEAFISVTSIDDDHRGALDALARLYEQRGEQSMALDAMEKLTRLEEDEDRRVELFYRMGRLYDAELGDRVAAVESFEKAIDIDPAHLPSLLAMRDIHVDEADWHAAARVLEQASEVEQPARKAAELRVDLGVIYDEQLSEHERAIEVFEDAIKLDPDSAGAAKPLVKEYVDAERFADAEPLLKMLVYSGDLKEDVERQRYWYTYGQVTSKLDDVDASIKAYSEAFSLDSQDLPALMGLAAAYFKKKDWDNAHKYYQMLLVHHRDELGAEEVTDTLYHLGLIKQEQGELRKAFNMFDKALEEDSAHRPTLEALIALNTREKDWEQVVHFKKRLVECSHEESELFELYEQIGDHWQKELKNPAMAIEAFVEGLALQPQNHVMLHKLLQLYSQTSQWEHSIEIIDRISDLEERPEAKAKYANTVGVILRDEMKDPEAALERFGQALDLNPGGQLKAFEAINKILTQKKDWKQLERAFRKMLHRLAGKGEAMLEFNLWHSLGVIYRDRLKNLESAAEAFAMASKLQPDNMQEHVILAEIFALVPDRVGDAVKEHQILLRQDPYRVDSYRQLYKLYFGARRYDSAWCVAATLNFLKKADTEQKQFYEQYRPEGPIRPKSRLNNERWVKDLFHPEEDFLVGKLFEAMTPAVLRLRAQPDKTWQLRKKDLIADPMNTTVAFARTFGFATQVMSLPLTPRLFVCPDRPGALDWATTLPPASVCGSALLSGVNPLEVIFTAAKHLSYYRGEHYIRTIFRTKDELKLLLAAGMQIAGVGISDPNVDQAAAQIRTHMQPSDLELLRSIGKRFVEAGARTDIKKWIRTVELTGCRAGLLLCNDLDIAARMIQREPPTGAVDLTPKEKVEELVLFSVSEEYFRLRESLGIQINVG
ncbi:MAG: tetratricopeptide repeat protein [Myxococcales bacterium]|nr:tetratricopeptide repeat protein [Myxococcales bacterium]